jgi:hypothetical protein
MSVKLFARHAVPHALLAHEDGSVRLFDLRNVTTEVSTTTTAPMTPAAAAAVEAVDRERTVGPMSTVEVFANDEPGRLV